MAYQSAHPSSGGLGAGGFMSVPGMQGQAGRAQAHNSAVGNWYSTKQKLGAVIQQLYGPGGPLAGQTPPTLPSSAPHSGGRGGRDMIGDSMGQLDGVWNQINKTLTGQGMPPIYGTPGAQDSGMGGSSGFGGAGGMGPGMNPNGGYSASGGIMGNPMQGYSAALGQLYGGQNVPPTMQAAMQYGPGGAAAARDYLSFQREAEERQRDQQARDLVSDREQEFKSDPIRQSWRGQTQQLIDSPELIDEATRNMMLSKQADASAGAAQAQSQRLQDVSGGVGGSYISGMQDIGRQEAESNRASQRDVDIYKVEANRKALHGAINQAQSTMQSDQAMGQPYWREQQDLLSGARFSLPEISGAMGLYGAQSQYGGGAPGEVPYGLGGLFGADPRQMSRDSDLISAAATGQMWGIPNEITGMGGSFERLGMAPDEKMKLQGNQGYQWGSQGMFSHGDPGSANPNMMGSTYQPPPPNPGQGQASPMPPYYLQAPPSSPGSGQMGPQPQGYQPTPHYLTPNPQQTPSMQPGGQGNPYAGVPQGPQQPRPR